jgi:hypothetical protein
MLVPMLVALMAWIGIAWVFWDTWTSGIEAFLAHVMTYSWVARWDLSGVVAVVAAVTVIVLLTPAIMITALLIASVFAMPFLVGHVAGRDFPTLERRRGGTLPGSIWNAFVAVFLFALLWVLTLPLWLFGPVAVVLPLLLSAYLNQRLFRYDALSEHADAQEMKRIFERSRGRLFLLGLATGAIYFVPLINLAAPVFAALAFIHLCLSELENLRSGARG